MCTYQRWCHWNGGVGEFWVYGVFGGIMKMVEGDIGRRKALPQDPHIQLTIEEPNQEGALSFLDTWFLQVPTTL